MKSLKTRISFLYELLITDAKRYDKRTHGTEPLHY